MASSRRNAAELERRRDDFSERLDDELITSDIDDDKAVAIRALAWRACDRPSGFTYETVRRWSGAWGEKILLPWLIDHCFVEEVDNPNDKYITLFKSVIYTDSNH
jgi:hypothetical protein